MSRTEEPIFWRRAEVIFSAALKKPQEERSALIEELCASDRELAQAVEELLASSPRESTAEGFVEAQEAQEVPAKRLGPYRLLQPLGVGGMARVFEAERVDGEVEQRVAVKFLQEPWAGGLHDRLLRRERQILAGLEHPNIARFLDAGTAPDGSPFFVLELVRGLPITEYADTCKLGVRARIALFLQVCRAVEFAHRNLVVHRDLKPGNILVTDSGQPKLLDFGIAKLLEASGEVTKTEERFHTPSYASPEQIAGGVVTTATDVYSLGVVLYRLFTGLVPRRATSPDEPSVTLPSVASMSTGVGSAREVPLPPSARSASLGLIPRNLAATLRGDLDAICRRCLEFHPNHRYGSVAELREDLERHLLGLPILARPQRWPLRAARFVKRHRFAALAFGILMLSLLTFSISTMVQLGRVEAERDAATRARAEGERVTRFLQETLSLADPFEQAEVEGRSDPDLSIREALELSSEKINRELSDQPRLQARLLQTLGSIYLSLGLPETALEPLERSVDLLRREENRDPAALRLSLLELTKALTTLGHFEEPRPLLEELIPMAREAGPAGREVLMSSLTISGTMHRAEGRFEAAQSLLEEAVAVHRQLPQGAWMPDREPLLQLALLRRRMGALEESVQLLEEELDLLLQGEVDPGLDHAESLRVLGESYFLLRRFEAAGPLLEKSYEVRREMLGDGHPDTHLALVTLGSFFQAKGDLANAETILRRAVATAGNVPDIRQRALTVSQHELAKVLLEMERPEEALPLFHSSLALTRETLGDQHPQVATHLYSLAQAQLAMEDYAAAEESLRESLATDQVAHDPFHPSLGYDYMSLANVVLAATGRPHDAESLARKALAIFEKAYPPGDLRSTLAKSALAGAYLEQGRLGEAEALLTMCLETLDAGPAKAHELRPTLRRLVDLYEASEKPQLAGQYRRRLARLSGSP